jgi:hypothetical protein
VNICAKRASTNLKGFTKLTFHFAIPMIHLFAPRKSEF